MTTKRFCASMALNLAALLAMPCARAQVPSSPQFNIPFEFTAGRSTLPAGLYRVWPVSQSAVAVQNIASNKAAAVITNSTQSKAINQAPALVFRRYGDQYFLAKILASGSNTGREVPANRREKELARNLANPPAQAYVAAK